MFATAGTLATRPGTYAPGTLAKIADGYVAAGEPDKAVVAWRMATQEGFFLPFAQASAEKQQGMIDDLPEGELRNTALAIQRHQADAFARDAFAAGTTLYRGVGAPVPIDDLPGRVRQAREIAQRRGGIAVAPFTAGEIDDMRRTMATGSDAEKQAVRVRLDSVPIEMRPTIEPVNDAALESPPNSGPQEPSMRTFGLDVAPGGLPEPSAGTNSQGAAASAGGVSGSPTTEPPPGSDMYRMAEEEARRVVNRQESIRRNTDRMITEWIGSLAPDDPSPPQMPAELAQQLDPELRQEVDKIADASVPEESDPKVYGLILRGLTSYNSQVRLKWAREPLFKHRGSLSAHDFDELALAQRRLDPHYGQILGRAPIPDDLVPLYDALAPDPESEYGTLVATGPDGRVRMVMPPALRSFFKGMLDTFAAMKTGEWSSDGISAVTSLPGAAGAVVGPRSNGATFTMGGKRPPRKAPSNPYMKVSGPRRLPPTPLEIAENKAVARQIAGGHAAFKHLADHFPGMTMDQFADHIFKVITHWTDRKDFSNRPGRTIYWHGPSGTVVFKNPSGDRGTALRPPDGKAYFDRRND
jgi:hypothetical protein